MKLMLSVFMSLFLVFLTPKPCLAEDTAEISGTWEGIIYLSELDIDMEIILVLAEDSGQVSGRISDDWGYLDCDITDAALRRNILTFKAMVETAQNDHQMVFQLKVDGDQMTGQWESLGSFGDWSLSKKKEGEDNGRKEYKIEDILGVWEGPAAYKSNPGSKNVLTLILEKKGGELHGTFSDQFGTNYSNVIVKSFQEGNLVLVTEFIFKNERYVMDVDIALKDKSHMRGKFKIEKMGRTGIWTAEKKAEQ